MYCMLYVCGIARRYMVLLALTLAAVCGIVN